MINEIGHFTLLLAFCVALLQATVPLFGAHKGRIDLMAISESAANLQFALLLASFGALTHAFMTSDFSVKLVVLNSHSLKPMLYKITGVWGNHEGSMLLWVLILSLFGASASWFGANLPILLKTRVLAIQGAIGVAFLAFIIFTSNPFERVEIPPFDGQDLNPLLQDPGLAFHPPFLYLGYVGLSMAFSFAVAALIEGRIDAAWGRWVRPWTLAAWIFLTIGIALGSWWAYYELGWGGFWFWDPVENASLIPWFCMTALAHSVLVLEKRNYLYNWVLILSIITFISSVTGTFLVRSGILNSVHTFANDPARGMYILIFLSLMIFFSFVIFFKRKINDNFYLEPISKETFILSNNWFMMFYLATVFIGTIYPIFTQVLYDTKISVGPPFYNSVIAPIIIPFLIMMAIGPRLNWIKQKYNDFKSLIFILILSCVINFLIFSFLKSYNLLSNLIIISSLFLILYSLKDFIINSKTKSYYNLPSFLSHTGFGILMLFIILNHNFSKEYDLNIKVGETKKIDNIEIKFEDLKIEKRENYNAIIGNFNILELKKNYRKNLNPEIRIYNNPQTLTFESAIKTNLQQDLYLTMSNIDGSDFYNVKFQIKPFMLWIWFAALLTASGGLLRTFLKK